MKWALQELNKYKGHQVEFVETINLAEELMKRDSSIMDVEPIKVSGYLQVQTEGYFAQFTIDTVLTLPSSRSLEPVLYPLSLMIDEEYMTPSQYEQLTDVSEEDKSLIMVLDKDLIDLKEAIVDFILLNLPLQLLTEAEQATTDLPKGNFWTVLSEEEALTQPVSDSEPTIDPRLAKLSELLEDKE